MSLSLKLTKRERLWVVLIVVSALGWWLDSTWSRSELAVLRRRNFWFENWRPELQKLLGVQTRTLHQQRTLLELYEELKRTSADDGTGSAGESTETNR